MSILELKRTINCLLEKKGKKQVYIDVSGSMPKTREIISFIKNKKVESFGFDTEIVSLEGPLRFGGTSFSPIRDAVEKNPLHPEIIIVVTDGYINDCTDNLKHPENWHFVLTNEMPVSFLPKNCHYHRVPIKV